MKITVEEGKPTIVKHKITLELTTEEASVLKAIMSRCNGINFTAEIYNAIMFDDLGVYGRTRDTLNLIDLNNIPDRGILQEHINL